MAGKKNGIILEYNSCKILLEKYFIFNDKQEGEYILYSDNGQITEIINYKNDKMEGEYKIYYKNDQLYQICNLKNDKVERKI